MLSALERIDEFLWGIPLLILTLGAGIYLTVRMRFIQFRLLPKAMKRLWRMIAGRAQNADGVTPFQALCTALAATVGTGNLAGVAGAIAIGGPGSIFWMWICGFLGMATKFAEVVLAVHFRTKNVDGELVGGPMYMIRYGMGKRWQWLAVVYSFFGIVAAFGVGNATQINTAHRIRPLRALTGVPPVSISSPTLSVTVTLSQRSVTIELCHCEPVRTLAWQSASVPPVSISPRTLSLYPPLS